MAGVVGDVGRGSSDFMVVRAVFPCYNFLHGSGTILQRNTRVDVSV